MGGMKYFGKLILGFTFLTFFSINIVKAAIDSFLVTYYDLKVNRSEQTCRLVNHPNLPESRRTLEGRGCLCDFDCVEYKDCCIDSRYYQAAEQSGELPFHCMESESVYVKTKCAQDWHDSQMGGLCEMSTKLPQGEDFSIHLPISNVNLRKTYGNSYCAVCNHDQDMSSWVAWKMGVACGEAPAGFPKKPIYTYPKPGEYLPPPFQEFGESHMEIRMNAAAATAAATVAEDSGYNSNGNRIAGPAFILDINLYLFNSSIPEGHDLRTLSLPVQIETNMSPASWTARSKRGSEPEDVVDFQKYRHLAQEIATNANYDSYTGKYVSYYENRPFICEFGALLPEDAELFTRKCVPNLIRDCADDYDKDIIFQQCSLYTQVVYNAKNNNAYRNVDCARCNGEKDDDVQGQPQTRGGFSDDFSSERGTGNVNAVGTGGKFVPSGR